MFKSLFLICLLINISSAENNKCYYLNSKLNKYGIHINIYDKDFIGLKLCQDSIDNYCCPHSYEDEIQNTTSLELYQLFELHSFHLHKPLQKLTIHLNETIIKLIESSRSETHSILIRIYKNYYNFYRSSIDLFYNHLLKINYKNYQYDVKNIVEELFRNILRITLTLNNQNKPLLPSHLLCIWRNQPFGNRLNIIINQLEINLGKLFHLNELLKLSIELVQSVTTSVTTDNHCIDSYIQLSYCNLCSGRKELPCLSNCINVMESCLTNVTLVNDVWIKFIDSIENNAYFNGIEKVLLSIGVSISDSLMTLFNSEGIQNKDIIDQCGYINIEREIFDNNQKFHYEYSDSLSLLDQQLNSMSKLLQTYRSFWLLLPEQICKSNQLSAAHKKACWTGSSVSLDDRQSVRNHYDKPLSLRVQRILKEIKEKSQIIHTLKRVAIGMNNSSITMGSLVLNELRLNLTDDYPDDNEFDYFDYAYEDSTDESTSTTSTTISTSSVSYQQDIYADDANTISYYDYIDHDVYSDDETDLISTEKSSTISTTTKIRIPSYHQRHPIIWKIEIDEDFIEKTTHKYNSSFSLNYSFVLLLLNFILT